MLVSLGKVKHLKKVSTCVLNSPTRKVATPFSGGLEDACAWTNFFKHAHCFVLFNKHFFFSNFWRKFVQQRKTLVKKSNFTITGRIYEEKKLSNKETILIKSTFSNNYPWVLRNLY